MTGLSTQLKSTHTPKSCSPSTPRQFKGQYLETTLAILAPTTIITLEGRSRSMLRVSVSKQVR